MISNISYCGRVVEQRIRGLFPGHPFEFILATSEYLFRKPNKRIFRLALEKAGLAPQDAWYIGDQYECDIVGATGAGLFPVWYTGAVDMPCTPHEAVLTVGCWEEVRKCWKGVGMTAEEMWSEYARKEGMEHMDYEAWAFGDEVDVLAALVASGRKTATASAFPCMNWRRSLCLRRESTA